MSQNVPIITHPSGADAAVLGACLIARSRMSEPDAAVRRTPPRSRQQRAQETASGRETGKTAG